MQIPQTDTEIIQNIQAITTLLEKAQGISMQTLEKLQLASERLQQQIANYPDNFFSYEWYEAAAHLLAAMSQIRLMEPPLLSDFSLFNAIATLLQNAIYRHPELQALRPPVIDLPADPIAAAQLKVQVLTDFSQQMAAKAAGMERLSQQDLKKIQQAQRQGINLSAPEVDATIRRTLTLFAKGAASALAADQAAAAIAELERLLNPS